MTEGCGLLSQQIPDLVTAALKISHVLTLLGTWLASFLITAKKQFILRSCISVELD